MTFHLCHNNIYFHELLFLLDINECVRGTHTCDKRPGASTCTNTIGSCTCKCNTGYEGNGHICKGIEFRKLLNALFTIFISINIFFTCRDNGYQIKRHVVNRKYIYYIYML